MKLELILEELWAKSRFTSYFYQGVDLIEEDSIPTIALGLYSSRLTLFYNQKFISNFTNDEFTGLLVHEMLHILLNHDHRFFEDGDIYLQNLAQDMVINSYILENRKKFFSGRNREIGNREIIDKPELIIPRGLPVVPEQFFADTTINDPFWEEVYRWLKLQPEEDIKRYRFT
ncbi:MAG: hypothetical protein FWH53_02830, partial [Leptospirales bacterium]|nr:hypothetical protein [Leptospirales bacterium]